MPSRSRVKQGKERMQPCSRPTASCSPSRGSVGGPNASRREVASGVKHSACILTQAGIEVEWKYLQTMIPRVQQQVMRQARERIFKGGNPHSSGKLLSLFEAHTEIIRKGKASKPTEAEQQIVTHYEVYDERPSDSDLVVPALDVHEQQFGHSPSLVAADAGFFSAHNEAAAHATPVESSESRFPTVPPRAQSARSCRRSGGSATARSGAQGPKAASAS